MTTTVSMKKGNITRIDSGREIEVGAENAPEVKRAVVTVKLQEAAPERGLSEGSVLEIHTEFPVEDNDTVCVITGGALRIRVYRNLGNGALMLTKVDGTGTQATRAENVTVLGRIVRIVQK